MRKEDSHASAKTPNKERARGTPRAEEKAGIEKEKQSSEMTRKTPVRQCAVAKPGHSSKKNMQYAIIEETQSRSQWALYREKKFKLSGSGCECIAT